MALDLDYILKTPCKRLLCLALALKSFDPIIIYNIRQNTRIYQADIKHSIEKAKARLNLDDIFEAPFGRSSFLALLFEFLTLQVYPISDRASSYIQLKNKHKKWQPKYYTRIALEKK